MKVSIIVCTIGRETIFDCIESLKNQKFEDFEIVVVSCDISIKNKIDGVKFVYSSKANVSYQRNLGIQNSKGEFVCFIDDDAIADKFWIKNLIKNFVDDKIVCVGGKINLMFEGKVPKELDNIPRNIFKGFLGATILGNKKMELKKPLLWGSNICFRKEIFDKVGYFDEKIGRTLTEPLCNEDIEIQERILKKGFKIIYDPKALIWHRVFPEKLTKEFFLERAFWQGYSDVLAKRREENMKRIMEISKIEIHNFLLKEKVFEEIFRLLIIEDLKEKINKYQKIGRGIGFLELIKGEK